MFVNNNQRIEKLAQKFDLGTIDQKEFCELLDWYNSFDDTTLEIAGEENLDIDDIKHRMFDYILSHRDATVDFDVAAIKPDAASVRIPKFWKATAAIAAVALLIMGTWWLLSPYQKSSDPSSDQIVETIKPGHDKAILRLEDGSIVELHAQHGGLISGDAIRYADGPILVDSETLKKPLHTQWLTLETPKGGTYQLTLSDGTRVWLNANSKIKYPASFASSNDRIVEVAGEAYFEVNKQVDQSGKRIPFIVKANRQQIEVLGTEFNVSDYAHLAYTHTTLLSGRVAIGQNGKDYVLKPGQQLMQNRKGSILKKVNASNYIAWKNNKFNFEDKSLDEILDEIAIWYDIQVIYKSGIPDVQLVGDAYRHSDFSLILSLLKVAKVNYKLDIPNRKLIIN